MAKKSQHVVPDSTGRWSVRGSNSLRATRSFDTQMGAVTYARSVARRMGTEVYVHDRDGRIRSKDSYCKDLFPPKNRCK